MRRDLDLSEKFGIRPRELRGDLGHQILEQRLLSDQQLAQPLILIMALQIPAADLARVQIAHLDKANDTLRHPLDELRLARLGIV